MNGFSLRICIAKWLPMAIAIVGVSGLAYVGLQQLNRNQMNSPQVQMAEDAASALANGTQPSAIVPSTLIDARQSLAPWIGIYGSDGKPVTGDVVLDGQVPTPPSGVFASALARGEDRITWQPQGSVRIALVVVPVPNSSGYFVASGRSIRDAEAFIDDMTSLFMGGVLFLLAITLALELFGAYRHARAMANAPHHA